MSVQEIKVWRPTIIDAHESTQFAQLIQEYPHTQVYNSIALQLRELADTRNPEIDLEDDAAEHYIKTHILNGASLDTYGSWVHYPWDHRVVRFLERDDFVELRTSRNRNKITTAEQQLLLGATVGIVGLSVGKATALTYAMERIGGHLKLADFDEISLSNLNRLQTSCHHVGLNKAICVAREIAAIDPFINISVYTNGITDDNIEAFFGEGDEAGLDLLIEECDDLRMKLVLRERARSLGIPVIMETSDRGLIDIERFDLEPNRPLLHGLVRDLRADDLTNLSTEEKVPYIMDILGGQSVSVRGSASMLQIGTTLNTWPQLASAVSLGAATSANAARRILLGELRVSGRFYVDLDELIREGKEATIVLPPEPEQVNESLSPPTFSTGTETKLRILEAGALAPSGGNCQPWRFESTTDTIDCFVDKDRSKFSHLASHLALGAVAENIFLAAGLEGLSAEVIPYPVADDISLACRVLLSPGGELTAVDSALAKQIPLRSTNRQKAKHIPLEPTVMEELHHHAAERHAELKLLTSSKDLHIVAGLVGAADRIRMTSAQMHEEMMQELRWTAEEVQRTRDGLDIATLDLSGKDRVGLKIMCNWSNMRQLQRFGGAGVLETLAKKLVPASSAVGLLTVKGRKPVDYFYAGRAMQRIWLATSAHGLGLHPLATLPYFLARLEGHDDPVQPCTYDIKTRDELMQLREVYRETFSLNGHGAEPLLFRIISGPPPRVRALRRHIGDML